MVSPMQPDELTYGVATVNGIDLGKDQQGRVTGISDVSKVDFSAALKAGMSAQDTDLLVLIHGFDNSFSDAITRAAFNKGVAGRIRTTPHESHRRCVQLAVPGKTPGFPPDHDYKTDRGTAQNSGAAIMTFFSRLEQVLAKVRRGGDRVTLLAHSMGSLALEAGVETWFLDGNGPVPCLIWRFWQPAIAAMIRSINRLLVA